MLRTFFLIVLFISFILYESCDAVKIISIDFKSEQLYQHKTSQFYDYNENIRNVIIRRGNYFEFKVYLNTYYNKESVDVTFTFQAAKSSMVIQLPSNYQRYWTISQSAAPKSVNLRVYIPANAPVGIWNMELTLKNKFGIVQQKLRIPNKIIILFNPMSSADAVYMSDKLKLKEYVFNEVGLISQMTVAKVWFYNQFKEGILDAVLYILGKTQLTAEQRGDPVMVIRELKLVINDNPNGRRGVLAGKWHPPYDTYYGRPANQPLSWGSSTQILQSYFKSGGVPVAYGQCWVFAAVMTTILRAIGIPSRPITVINSAIDHDNDLTVDKHFNSHGFIDTKKSDWIWNFHVWNQVWMSRKDLQNSAYGQWQDVDGTPQEIRDGFLQNGPSPTNAVRMSHVDKSYDSDIIYGQVNADVVYYNYLNQIINVDTKVVGTSVYTKVVGNNSLEDIVHLYKPREGTKEERQSYNAAARVKGITPASTRFGRSRRDTVAIEIIAVKKAAIGSKVTILIKVKSLSLKTQTVTLGIKITSVYYDGQDSKTLVERQFSGLKLAAHSTKRLQVILDQNDYVDKLEAFNTNRIEAVVMTEDGHFAHAVQKLSFTVPKLHITCPKVVGVNEEFILKAEFKNPFNKTLKNCKFTYEGSRIEKNEVNLNDVTVGERVAIELRIKARYPRNETIIVTFVSSSLKDVEGTANVQIIGEKPKQPVISFPPRPPTDKGVNSVKENQSFDSKV